MNRKEWKEFAISVLEGSANDLRIKAAYLRKITHPSTEGVSAAEALELAADELRLNADSLRGEAEGI